MLSRAIRANTTNSLKLKLNNVSRRSMVYDPHLYERTDVEKDKALRRDVRNLGSILGNTIHKESADVFQSVENLRNLGREVNMFKS